MFQRQLSKEGLKSAVSADADTGECELMENTLSASELRQLFIYNADTLSDCHDALKCPGCEDGHQQEQVK